MISTTVRPGFGSSVVSPQRFEFRRSPRRCRRAGNPGYIIGISPTSEAPCTLFWPRSGCRPVPGRPTCPVIIVSAIRQRALSVPWMCCEMPMPHRIIDARDVANRRATSRIFGAGMPQTGAIASGLYVGDVCLQFLVALRAVVDEALRDQPFLDDRVHHRVQQRDVGVRLELQVMRRVPGEFRAARVGEDRASCRSSPRS